MADFEVYATKKGPGAVIKGFEAPEKVFDDISGLLYDFYEQKGLLFVPEHDSAGGKGHGLHKINPAVPAEFDPDREYSHRVYKADMHEAENGKVFSHMHGFISLKYIGGEHKTRYNRKWDFRHAPSEWDEQNFLAYFNLIERDAVARQSERDQFIRAVSEGICRPRDYKSIETSLT